MLEINTACKSLFFVASGTPECNFVDGDGIGGTETFLQNTNTRDECVALVIQTQPNANGVTYSGRQTGGTSCYAEFGATGTSGGTSWQTCIFKQGNASCTMISCCLQIICNVKAEIN